MAEDESGFPKMSAPARRALANAGYSELELLTDTSETELRRLHGMGPSAIRAVRAALADRGLALRDP
jgi:hypothetical protein